MWRLTIENVAGIRSGTATIEPGINAIQASNWQGKSSLVAAIETILGTATPLTSGEDRGRVELKTDDGTIVTELVRKDGSVSREGEVLLAQELDRVCAELFAALGETNELRRAVREGEDLESLLSRPLDFENIDEQIAELRHERNKVERELERAEAAAAELPTAQERVTSLESELADLRDELAEVADGEPTDDDLEVKRDRLSEKRTARDRTVGTIDRLDDQIEALETKIDERQQELEDLSVPDESAVEAELETARDELSTVETDVDLLQSVYNANRRVIEEGRSELVTEVEHGLAGDAIKCWVCGERADRTAFEDRLDALAEEIADRRKRTNDLRGTVEKLEDKHSEIGEKRRRERDLEDEIDRLSTRLADRRADLEAATDRYETLLEEVETLETAVEGADEHRTDIQSEIKYKEAELADAREDLEALEADAEQRAAIEATLEEITEEIEKLRTRRDRKRREAREAFDDAMSTVLSTFEPGFEAARLTADFELVVARDGREVGLDALSEGEIELLGIVAALAGYEAFDVDERVPVILLDGLGGLAAENLHRLIQYLDGRAEYLVTTAYPEQGGFEWNTISPDEWAVVSDRNVTA